MSDQIAITQETTPKRKVDQTAMIINVIKKKPDYMNKVPESKRTPKFIDEAIVANPNVLEHLTEKEQTRERCTFCVNIDGLLLRFIKDQTDKDDIINRALQQNYEALQFVHHQTPDLCQQVINRKPDAIRFVKIQDYHTYYLAVYLDASLIRYVPQAFQSDDIVRLAASKQVNLEHIVNPTPEIISTTFAQDRDSIDNIAQITHKYDYIKIEFDNTTLKTSYKDNIKVLINDIEKNKIYYNNYTKNLLGMVFDYITAKRGDEGLLNAKSLFNRCNTDLKQVEKDSQFKSGLFIIEKGEKSYELWEKILDEQPYDGLISYVYTSTIVVKNFKLIRTYQLMEMEFQQ